MNFVYPNFLWALLLLAVPVIIHLFNFRRYQSVYFSKVDLLNEAIEDSKSGNKLKHLLVLLSRILAVAALVFAFAQPYFSTKEQKNTKVVSSIYIDNSFSMQAQGQDGNLLNEAKNKAIELVSSFSENEKINLLTADLLSKDQRFYTKSDIIDRIKSIDFSPAATTLESATTLQVDILNKDLEQADKRLFIFSDFQKSTSEIGTLSDSTILPFIYQPKAEVTGNIFIDSMWFNSPIQSLNAPSELFFRVQNLTDQSIENLTVELSINGKEKGLKSLSIAAQSYTDQSISFSHATAGVKEGKLSIKTNQLFFDDQFFFTYTIKNETNILIVNDKQNIKNSFAQLYDVNTYYNHHSVNIDQLKQEDLKNQSLIIINGANSLSSGTTYLLDEALNNGATVVLIPGPEANLVSWNEYLSKKKQPTLGKLKAVNSNLKYFNDSDPIYTGVFEKKPDRYKMTNVTQQYPLMANSSQNFITLFGTQKNNPFLLYSNISNSGRLFLQAGPLQNNFSDFDKQALFAATYLRIAETSSFSKQSFYTIGKIENYTLKVPIEEKAPLHLKNENLQFDLIPATSATANGRKIIFDSEDGLMKQAGFYELTNETDFSDKLAFNFDRAESITSTYSNKEILSLFKDQNWEGVSNLEMNNKGEIAVDSIKPKEYWRLCLYLAILFLAIEIALLKWWKTS